MTLIIFKSLLAVVALYMSVGLVWSLRTGFVQYGKDAIGARAWRSQDPVSFWFIWLFNLGSVAFLFWLILRR